MKSFIIALAVLCITLSFSNRSFAGDKEFVQTLITATAESFNKHDFNTYFSYFADDKTVFPYVVSLL